MLSCCLKYKKDIDIVNPKALETSNGKTILLSKCAMFNSKKLKSINEQKARGFCNLTG